jgi:hypothetical protein
MRSLWNHSDFDYVKARFDAEHARAKSLSDSLT